MTAKVIVEPVDDCVYSVTIRSLVRDEEPVRMEARIDECGNLEISFF